MDNLQRMYNTLDVVLTETNANKFEFSDHLDKSYLDIIYGDDLEYAEEMFDLFLENTGDDLDELVKCMCMKNHSTVYQLAHKIKPTFAMVGLSDSGKLIEIIEGKAIEGVGDYVELIDEVKQIKNEKLPSVNQELIRIRKDRN